MSIHDGKGTNIYCPECKTIRACRSIDPVIGCLGRARNKHFVAYPEINFFQRLRLCQTCYHEFPTAEVDYETLLRLIEDRAEDRKLFEQIEGSLNQYALAQQEVQKAQKLKENNEMNLDILFEKFFKTRLFKRESKKASADQVVQLPSELPDHSATPSP